ncbi:MAG: gluconolactonase [Rhodospirillaceae bacterium]|nr:gluconolactonase [Rhodospirillaceae bacterium]|tara:strand:+ start:1114 stop:2046 length:933 start_codon:yes stop_codon:yes gene_type:complete
MSLYSPPTDISTEVFARVPERLRRPGGRPSWGEANRPGHDIDCFLEGPSFDRAGNLYVVNIPYGEIFRMKPGGEFDVVAQYDGWPNGLKVDQNGNLIVADYKRGILRVDPETGEVETIVDHRWSEGFRGCNDLHLASNGDIYFTDQGQTGMHDQTGRVYRYTKKGVLQLLVGNGPSPNGLVLNPDETVLYVGMTRGNAAWRVPLLSDGFTSKVSIYIQLSGGHGGPDGLAMDENGGLLICHAGLGSVWHFDSLGQPLHRIRSCEGLMTTNMVFGGADNRLLFITESETGTILVAELPTKGQAMESHKQAI